MTIGILLGSVPVGGQGGCRSGQGSSGVARQPLRKLQATLQGDLKMSDSSELWCRTRGLGLMPPHQPVIG